MSTVSLPCLSQRELSPYDLEIRKKSLLMHQSGRRTYPVIHILLFISFLANLLLFWASFQPTACTWAHQTSTSPGPVREPTTAFAGLARNVPMEWDKYVAGTPEEWADLWDNHTSYDHGIVALSDSYAQGMGLPRAQRWPWDPEKGIYLLNSHHNLHCVKVLRRSLEEFRYDKTQSRGWGHIQHCLLVLRDQILCDADDTPRYTGFQAERSSGYGQVRMCRDWKKLEDWARQPERAGCFKDIPDANDHIDQYRFCDIDNKYKKASEAV